MKGRKSKVFSSNELVWARRTRGTLCRQVLSDGCGDKATGQTGSGGTAPRRASCIYIRRGTREERAAGKEEKVCGWNPEHSGVRHIPVLDQTLVYIHR